MKTRISPDFSIVHPLIILALVPLAAPGVFGQVMYSVTDLGTLPGGTYSVAYGVNNKGQVVGGSTISSGDTHAFLYSGGTMIDLNTLPGETSSGANCINNNGQVVGNCIIGGLSSAFLYSDGRITDLVLPGGAIIGGLGINDNGQILSSSFITGNSGTEHAFLYSGGTKIDLGTLPGFSDSYGYGINNNGQIVGYSDWMSGNVAEHAFLYSGGTMIDLGTLPGGTYSVAYGINNKGQVVGGSTISSGDMHAFLYTGGTMIDLGTLGAPANATGINNNGQVVGWCGPGVGGSDVGAVFLYDGKKMWDVSDLIPFNSGLALQTAYAINDNGQIVGMATSPSGRQHAFLLNPLPPGAIYACTNSQTSLPTYGICPTNESGKDSLLLITHGWINPLEQITPGPLATVAWVDSMSNSIAAYLTANGLDNWRVYGFKWLVGASQLGPMFALINAEQQGTLLGNLIAQGEWKHIHFIAHSAGAGLIQKATEQIKATLTNTTIHCTFLDAYDGLVGEKAYEYGTGANWSDSYFVRDDFQRAGWTGRILPYAYNVDVTALDPQATTNLSGFVSGSSYNPSCNNILESTHGWPIAFYANSIAGAVAGGNMSSIYDGSYYDNFGLLLSEECGNWAFATSQYPPGNGVSYGSVTNLGPENGTCIPPYVLPPGYIGTAPAYSVVSSIKSITGTIETWVGSVILKTGSPAWIATVITDTNALNYVSFDAEFTSASGSDGLLSVYWDTNMIGLIDEAAVLPGFQHYNLSYPNTAPNTSHVLGFHLDPFTSVQSVIVITNIVTGYVGVSQPFSLSITTNTSNGLLVYQLTGQRANYTIMSSPDLVNWTNIAFLANTNGTVNFVDPQSANHKTLFYRAMASSGMTQ